MKTAIIFFIFCILAASAASAGTVTRSLSRDVVQYNEIVHVTLSVALDPDEHYFIIREQIPSALLVTGQGAGRIDAFNQLKIANLTANSNTVYDYYVQVPSIAGSHTFTGTALFQDDTLETGTQGSTTLRVVPPDCTYTPEVCDGVDNDCDGRIDCGLAGCSTPILINATSMSLQTLANGGIVLSSVHGSIMFNDPFAFTCSANLNTLITFQNNRITVNTATLFEFRNKSAQIGLFNLTMQNPRPLKDGSLCSTCQELNYSNGRFYYNTTGFSEYRAEETPTCSDRIQNQGEQGVDCGGPCEACSQQATQTVPGTNNDAVSPWLYRILHPETQEEPPEDEPLLPTQPAVTSLSVNVDPIAMNLFDEATTMISVENTGNTAILEPSLYIEVPAGFAWELSEDLGTIYPGDRSQVELQLFSSDLDLGNSNLLVKVSQGEALLGRDEAPITLYKPSIEVTGTTRMDDGKRYLDVVLTISHDGPEIDDLMIEFNLNKGTSTKIVDIIGGFTAIRVSAGQPFVAERSYQIPVDASGEHELRAVLYKRSRVYEDYKKTIQI
ncbi:putative metal-binding motif-containing protein [Candidatus Woesearchaeota archaeon]|nr:putative metal-binding motif-containing protein [Candidatus Woesearchaeota archaeon]